MTSKVVFGVRALAVVAVTLLATACSVSRTPSTARIVITGSPERVHQFLASQTSGRTALRAAMSAPDAQGQVAATLALPQGSTSDEVMRLMTGAMEARLTVSYTATGATRTFRLG